MGLPIRIGSHRVGPGQKTLIVAEIGGNHGGDPALARRLVAAASGCGADAVKFQAYRTADFLSPASPYFDELAAEELPFEDLARLVDLAHSLGLAAGLTVFDRDGLDLAGDCGADFIKISSGDLTYGQLLAAAARTGRPLILSTGAAEEAEVRQALAGLEEARERLIILQCTSLYPAPPESAALAVMDGWLAEGLSAGYSDHVLGPEAALAAVRLGAVVLEKHFTIDRQLPGGDNAISAEEAELALIAAEAVRRNGGGSETGLEPRLLGEPLKKPHPLEVAQRALIRRVVVAAEDLPAGRRLRAADLALKRPPAAGQGHLPPDRLPELIGRATARAVPAGWPLTENDLAAASK